MRRLLAVLALVGAVGMLSAPAALAQETVTAQIEKKAFLIENGQAVQVTVTVTCASGSQVLEAFVYVVQDGNMSQFAGIPVLCDDAAHAFTVRVAALDTPFHPGRATASGFVLVTTATGTASTSPTAGIRIRP